MAIRSECDGVLAMSKMAQAIEHLYRSMKFHGLYIQDRLGYEYDECRNQRIRLVRVASQRRAI